MKDFSQWSEAPYLVRWHMVDDDFTQHHQVLTPLGMVLATLYTWDDFKQTRLETFVNGRLWVRTWKRVWKPRTITRLSREFLEDVSKIPTVQLSLFDGV